MSARASTVPLLFRRLGALLAKRSDGLRKPEARAVGHCHLVLPRQPVTSGNQIAHEGVRAIPGSALDRDVAAVAELIDVVLDAPALACVAHEVGPDLGGD